MCITKTLHVRSSSWLNIFHCQSKAKSSGNLSHSPNRLSVYNHTVFKLNNNYFSESRSLILVYALNHPIHRGIYRAPLTSGESPISVIIKLQDSSFIFMTFNDEELCIVKWWVEIKTESELDNWKTQIDQRLTKNSYIIGTSSLTCAPGKLSLWLAYAQTTSIWLADSAIKSASIW